MADESTLKQTQQAESPPNRKEAWCLTRKLTSLYNGRLRGSLAQSVEQRTFNPLVARSSRARPTKLSAPWSLGLAEASAKLAGNAGVLL